MVTSKSLHFVQTPILAHTDLLGNKLFKNWEILRVLFDPDWHKVNTLVQQ